MDFNHSNVAPSKTIPWTVQDSERLYQVQGWGEPYFSINAGGHAQVSPLGSERGGVDLLELVQELKEQGTKPPFLLRFPDILGDRLARLNQCFEKAIAQYDYQGSYQGVYPVKCNQHRPIVEALLNEGNSYNFGLEVGAKPELMIAIAMVDPQKNADSLVICNGYKDQQYIETALLASQLGHKIIIVIEQAHELELILAASQKLAVHPVIGIRAKLASQGIGRWGSSSGDHAKFGVTVPQMLQIMTTLQEWQMVDCLQLLHYHIGSQLSSISVVKSAIREASHIYAELVRLGANIRYLDVGGGLAVDYNGSKNNFASSKNYSMQNYASDIVATVKDTCREKNIVEPVLVSESGRAIASHQEILIFDVLSSSEVKPVFPPKPDYREHLVLRNLRETYELITPENCQESYNDAIQFKDEAISLFNLGYLSLGDRANAEALYWSCCSKIFPLIQSQINIPDDLATLRQNMSTIYYGNLSVFQSVPDSWAIDQLFPVMPIHRLDEQPTKAGVIADLTCDSDGRVNQFIDPQTEHKNLLELHPLGDCPYYLGLFLVGAYQNIMGNFHNLFGQTHTIQVRLTEKGHQIEALDNGQTVGDVLGMVQYDPQELVDMIQDRVDSAVQAKRLSSGQSTLFVEQYRQGLESYTYLS